MPSKNNNKRSKSKVRGREMRKFVEAGGQRCVEFFRHLASSQQWREHGTLPPLSNDEALILNHMYQIWLNQSPEEKESFLHQGGGECEGEESSYSRHFHDTLHQQPALLSHPHSSSGGDGSIVLPSHPSPQGQASELSSHPHSVSVSLCIKTIKANLAQHTQYSDSLLQLVNQLDVLIKAPEPTRTHANDLVVMLLSPDFIHRDLAALEKRIDLVSSMQQRARSPSQQQKEGQQEWEEWERERQVRLSVASACCILLALLAESEHRITERYQASLPAPFQQLIALNSASNTKKQPKQQQGTDTMTDTDSQHVNDNCTEGGAEVKRLYDDIATSYYLRSLTIAFSPPLEDGNSSSAMAAASTNGCGGRNSIAAMQLGSKYLRGGVEQGALLSGHTQSSSGSEDSSSSSSSSSKLDDEHAAAVLCCEQEYRQAFQWYLQAALLENPIAQHKVGYFYDEGLPCGACDVHIVEAVKWYSRAAEVMPDSMHNLAKIYEDGRGGFEADLPQAVTLYSVAAARGFPLSQVNLGRLFLLGEEGEASGGGVRRDREAGKRLLTLAAESGDADAQMVVGMIHATPAFECYDLALSEHWLRCSLAGGKQDAERLLGRVRQQLQQQQLLQDESVNKTLPNTASVEGDRQGGIRSEVDSSPSVEGVALQQTPPVVPFHHETTHQVIATPVQARTPRQLAEAAKQRGEDFRRHRLLHAAVLEFSRAFELDRSCLGHFVDRLETLFLLGHFEECLSDSSLLLDCVDVHGEKLGGPHVAARRNDDLLREESDERGDTDNAIAMKRLYMVLSKCLSCMHSDRDRDSRATGGTPPLAPRGREEIGTESKEKTGASMGGLAENFIGALTGCHRDALVRWLLIDCMELSGPEDQLQHLEQRSKGLGAARASAFLARLSSLDAAGNRSIVRNGGVPMLVAVLDTVCQSIWLSSSHPCTNFSSPSPTLSSSSSHTSCETNHQASLSGGPKYAFVREQLWLNCLVVFQHLLNPPAAVNSMSPTLTPPISGEAANKNKSKNSDAPPDEDEVESQEQHSLLQKKKLLKRRKVVQLISAADGYCMFTNCAVACLQAIIQTASFRTRKEGQEGRASSALGADVDDDGDDAPNTTPPTFTRICGDENTDSDHEAEAEGDEERESIAAQLQQQEQQHHVNNNHQQELHYYYFRDCIALTRATTTIMQILHCTSTVADCSRYGCLWPELLRGGLVQTFSCCIASSVLTAQLQLEALCRGGRGEERGPVGEDAMSAHMQQQKEDEEDEDAPAPLPVLVKEANLNTPAPTARQDMSSAGSCNNGCDNSYISSSRGGGGPILPFHLQVGHLCIALRHLSLTLQAALQLLQRAPLEVLLRLSASDTMAALHQILRVLCPPPLSPFSFAGKTKAESGSLESMEAAGSDPLQVQMLAASVRKNFLAAKEPPPPPASASSSFSTLLSLSLPPSALLGHLPPAPSALMLAALLLPLSAAEDGVSSKVRLLSTHLARMSPAYSTALASCNNSSSHYSSHSKLPSGSNGNNTSSRGGEDGGGEEGDVVLPSLHSLGAAAGELKTAAAACLCALLCARDPRNSELLRAHFAASKLNDFLYLVYHHEVTE